MGLIMSKRVKALLGLVIAVIIFISSLCMDLFSIRAKAAIGDDGITKVRVLFDSINIEELGQSGRFWLITVDDIPAFCMDFGASASTGVTYDCFEYCKNIAINKAGENFFNGNMNDETYIMTQGYIWAVLYGKDPYKVIAEIETELHGDYSREVVEEYINAINAANPTKEYGIFHSSRPGDQRLLSSRDNDPKIEQPKYSTVHASANSSGKTAVNISIKKTDNNTGEPLENVEFDFYADDNKIGSAKTNSDGIASTNYEESIVSTATSKEYKYCSNYDSLNSYNKEIAKNNVSYLSYDAAYNTAYNEALQAAREEADRKAGMISHKYKAVETKTRDNYYYISGQNMWQKELTGSGSINLNAVNDYKTGEISIRKVDREIISSQGDAMLSGAIYGLFAREDILHPDGKTGLLYMKDSLVKNFPATDTNGNTKLDNLYPGEYYVKEILAPTGYNKDDTQYNVTLKSSNQNEKKITVSKQLSDEVIKGKIKIAKHMQYIDYENQVKPQKPEENAEFEIIHKATGEVADTLITDVDGLAISKKLPYGKYIIHQTKGAKGCDFVNDFEVNISENDKEYFYMLENPIFHSGIKIVKVDSETKADIQLAGTAFKLFDQQGRQISMWQNYPSREQIEIFRTALDGTLLLPEQLPAGKYIIEEVEAPNGYLKGDPISFEVCMENCTKENGYNTIIVNYENKPVHGEIKVIKKGRALKGYNILTNQFEYEDISLPGVEFCVKAASDIFSSDGTIKYYGKDEIVEEIITDKTGQGVIDNLPLGEYYIEEIKACSGYYPDKERKYVKLSYEDDTMEVVYSQIEVLNNIQKLKVVVNKIDEETKEPLEGAEFSLYANKDINSYDNRTIVKRGELLAKAITKKDGRAVFDVELPYYEEDMYYIVETRVPQGYANQGKDIVLKVDENKLQDEIIQMEYVISNRKIKTKSVNLTNDDSEKIEEAETVEPVKEPEGIKTGDTTGIFVWIIIMMLQLLMIFIINQYNKNNRI